MDFINLTPHDLHIKQVDGSLLTIPRTRDEEGRVVIIRAATQQTPCDPCGTVAVSRTTYGAPEVVSVDAQGKDPRPSDYLEKVIGLIDPARNWTPVLVVSFIALQATGANFMGCAVLAPGELIRDTEGKPVGCNGLTSL